MADFDENNNRDIGAEKNHTGLNFSSIDENFELEDDILNFSLDLEYWASLSRLDLTDTMHEIILQDGADQEPISKELNDENSKLENGQGASNELDNDFQTKHGVLDWFNIDELGEDYDLNYEDVQYKENTELITLPPVSEENERLTPEEIEVTAKKKLETPLAHLIPPKYANVDICELFPDFRPNKSWEINYGPDPTLDEHDEEKLLMPVKRKMENTGENDDIGPKAADCDINISNDIYYLPRSSEITSKLRIGRGNLIQHSIPVVELCAPFIEIPICLRNFHRPHLKRYCHGPLSYPGPHEVLPLIKHIKKKAELREQERIASGGGNVFFMHTPEDLTGCDGELVLIEFSEEHPPLINQVGMCSKIKNYYKPTVRKDIGPPNYKYGETKYVHTGPFLGLFSPGQSIQAVENNMYRAPIYEHQMPQTDFLVIRSKYQYYIREVDALFVAGQECPLYEVPRPNSRRAKTFLRYFLQVIIYRLFCKLRKITIDDIRNVCPTASDLLIKNCLKTCALLKKEGTDKSCWHWVIKPDFRLPTEEEIYAIVSPEEFCAFLSMMAAVQRLKDAGYNETDFILQNDDKKMTKSNRSKSDDEIKAAPWNTSRAYIKSMKGKCLLQLFGPADPTGCGEGFSYISKSIKKSVDKEKREAQLKRKIKDTDADLRRLSRNEAIALLCKFGVPEEKIKNLPRPEVISLLRILSTEEEKADEEVMTRFSRPKRLVEIRELYQKECQHIFDVQNQVLSSDEVLSTDEGDSSDEDSSYIEEMGKYIESILNGELELRKMPMNNRSGNQDDKNIRDKKNVHEDENSNLNSQSGQVLKIYRTYRDLEGKEFTRVEIVREPAVINMYLKIRNSKDDTFIKQYDYSDASTSVTTTSDSKLSTISNLPSSNLQLNKPHKRDKNKIKCGACGNLGHRRTNMACSLYKSSIGNTNQDPINVTDGTKIKLSSELSKYPEKMKQQTLFSKVPTDVVPARKWKKATGDDEFDNLKFYKNSTGINQHSGNGTPVVLSPIFENIFAEVMNLPEAQPFLHPVDPKTVPDYLRIIARPMDLPTIYNNVHQNKYQTYKEFLADIIQIKENSLLYNGLESPLTQAAQRMVHFCATRIADVKDILIRFDETIDSLLNNDDNQVVVDPELSRPTVLKKKDFLEEAIFHITDEVPFGVDNKFEANKLTPPVTVNVRPKELPSDDNSKQVDKVMIQRSNIGFY